MKRLKYLPIFLILFSNQLFAQIIVTNLSDNAKVILENKKTSETKQRNTDTLQLPFIDDFSASEVFPNQALWNNKYVFINGDYPINPYSINVATFDILDDSGRIYKNANVTSFVADTLTSKLINIKSKSNIYFSFCYQPQGIGDAPEKNDSLVLEFYADQKKSWKRIWSDTGTTYQIFYQTYHKSFKLVMIPINDTAYYKNTFQFRFYNYASILNTTTTGMKTNCDQWNVDYIFIDSLRNLADTTFKDIAIIKKSASLLKNYYAMPWRQFKVNAVNETRSNTDMTICNLDKIDNSCINYYKIFKNNTVVALSDTTSNLLTITPFEIKNAIMPLSGNAFLTDANDNALFTVKKIIVDPTNNLIKSNDTIAFYQDFNNYYAYDDGNPEAGIGLTRTNSKIALKFTLNTPDTLRAVQIYFNATPNNANQRNFKLVVWKSIYPEVILYSKSGYIPVFGEDNNRYHYYRLDNPLLVSDTFYVGVQQTTDDFLNLGFDYNNNSKDNAFCKYAANWEQVPYAGSIMMRPVLGSEIPPNASTNELENTFSKVTIYPNPVKGNIINIELPSVLDKTNIQMQLFDIYGRVLFADKYCNVLNISTYSNGLYLIRLTNTDTKETLSRKIIISK